MLIVRQQANRGDEERKNDSQSKENADVLAQAKVTRGLKRCEILQPEPD